jgi:hypothetical protein
VAGKVDFFTSNDRKKREEVELLITSSLPFSGESIYLTTGNTTQLAAPCWWKI